MEKNEKPKKNFLKSLLFNDEKEEQPKETSEVADTRGTSVAAPAQQYSTPSTGMVGTVNPDIYKMLKAAVEDRNFPGPDYLELKNSANAMATILPDETQRFIAAYASLKATAGITKAKVIDSIDVYIGVVNEEKAQAEKELQITYDAEVGSRLKQLEELNAKIENAKADMLKLQELIMSTSQEINTVNREKFAKENELDIQKKNFYATVEVVINELSNDKVKLSTIITE